MGTVFNRKREFGIQLKLPFITWTSMMYDVGLLLKSFIWQWDCLQRWQRAKYKWLIIMFMSWQTAHPEPSPTQALPSTHGHVLLLPVIYYFTKACWRGRSVKWAMRPLTSCSKSSLSSFSASRADYKWGMLSIALWPILSTHFSNVHTTVTTWQRMSIILYLQKAVRFPIHLNGVECK